MSRIFFMIFMSKFFWSFVQCGNLSYESFNDGCGKEESSCRQYSFFNSKKWLSQTFMEAESRFHIGEKASKSCQQDFNKLRQHLSINQTSWAVRMFESSEWPRVGLLSGKKYHLGSWTECVNTDAKTFKGQYCLVEAKFDFSHLEKPRAVGMESSAWNDLQQFHEDPHQLVHLHHVYWAMCIPSSCQPSDLELSMKNIVDVVFTDYNDVAVKVKVNPKMCSVKTDDKVSFSFNLIASFFMFWIFLVMCATFWNKIRKKCKENSQLMSVELNYFSLSYNMKKLMEYPSDVYPVFYFVNGIVSLIIILAHRVYFYLGFPQFSASGIDKLPVHFSQLLFGSVLDFNFMISGYLLSHMYKHKFSDTNVPKVVLFLIFRWLRKISMLLIILPYVIYISSYQDNGPLFHYFVSSQIDACKSTWWALIFTMNNFNTDDNMCLLHTWFTSAEFQLTVLGIIIIFIMGISKKSGYLTALSFFIIATTLIFRTNVHNEFPALFTIPFSQINFMFTHPNARLNYMRPYTRLGPYLLGFFTASIVQELRTRRFKFSCANKISIILYSLVIAFKTYIFGCTLNGSDVIKNAFYASFYRSVLMLPFASFLCIFFTSGFGSFDKIFEKKIVVVYGRLLNCVYLVGPLVQLAQVIAQETFVTPSLQMLVWLAAGDFLIILFVAILGHLFFEAPLLNILRHWQKSMTK